MRVSMGCITRFMRATRAGKSSRCKKLISQSQIQFSNTANVNGGAKSSPPTWPVLYGLLGGIACSALILGMGYSFVKVANSDEDKQKERFLSSDTFRALRDNVKRDKWEADREAYIYEKWKQQQMKLVKPQNNDAKISGQDAHMQSQHAMVRNEVTPPTATEMTVAVNDTPHGHGKPQSSVDMLALAASKAGAAATRMQQQMKEKIAATDETFTETPAADNAENSELTLKTATDKLLEKLELAKLQSSDHSFDLKDSVEIAKETVSLSNTNGGSSTSSCSYGASHDKQQQYIRALRIGAAIVVVAGTLFVLVQD